MSKKIPDAWDDDWESLADKPAAGQITVDSTPAPAPKLTKSQRRALHAEQQKQLWDSAENPDRFHWLETQGVVPLKQEFKPQVKLLSRKPAAPVIAKKDASSDGLAKLNLDDEGDSDEEDRKKREADMEERQRQAKVLREEKQRKYAEARERIMGSPNPGQAAPAAGSRDNSHGRNGRDAKSRVNGRPAAGGGSQPTSSADQSPARPASAAASAGGGGKELLFDPDDMGRRLPRRELNATPKEDGPSRQPRGPDSSGRGGFGFAGRGGGTAA